MTPPPKCAVIILSKRGSVHVYQNHTCALKLEYMHIVSFKMVIMDQEDCVLCFLPEHRAKCNSSKGILLSIFCLVIFHLPWRGSECTTSLVEIILLRLIYFKSVFNTFMTVCHPEPSFQGGQPKNPVSE